MGQSMTLEARPVPNRRAANMVASFNAQRREIGACKECGSPHLRAVQRIRYRITERDFTTMRRYWGKTAWSDVAVLCDTCCHESPMGAKA